MRDALDLYDLPFYNNSGEAIPAYAIMQVEEWKDDANDRDYFRVKKPDGDGKTYIINGPLEIAIAGDGMGTRKDGAPARYLSGTPAADEEWGPVNASWYLSASGSGINIVGGVETIGGATIARVAFAGGSPGNIIYAQVVGAVATGDPTFTFDNAVAVVGSVPSGGTGTAQNQYAQEYVDNEWVFLFQNKTSGQWLTERGGTSGSQVVYFELTEDKGYADAAKLAKPVLPDGTLDSGADAFHVVDDQNQFYGLATYTDASPTTVHEGYRGFALRYTDDYDETEVPGFRIITMEGPAQLLLVELVGDVATAAADCNILSDPGAFGLAFRGRRPRIESAGFDLNVSDPQGVATEAKAGEKWIVTWDETNEEYIFLRPLQIFIRVKGVVGSTVSASTTSFSAGTIEVIQGDMPELSSGNITVYNVAKIVLANTAVAEFRWNREEQQWETEPLVCHQVLGLATAAVTGGTFNIDNIELVCGSDPRSDPTSSSETLSVANPFAWDIDDNGQVLAVKKASGTWIAVQAACPA